MHPLLKYALEGNTREVELWFRTNTYEENKPTVEHAFDLACRSGNVDTVKYLEQYLEYGHNMDEAFITTIDADSIDVFLYIYNRYGDDQDDDELMYKIMDNDSHEILAVFLSGRDDAFVEYMISYSQNFDSPDCQRYLKVRERAIKLENL